MIANPTSAAKAPVLIVLGALALSVLFFSPRLWLMTEEVPGSFQWSRATTFLLQCEAPFRTDVEPAMLWRLLPPIVAHGLHLPGKSPLLLPWLGVIAITGYVAVLLRRRSTDNRFVFGGTLLFATTSAVLVPVGWLGLNDAWVWLGLLAVAFGRSVWAAPLACLLCPWIDERFLIGFPLAWLTARLDRGEALFGRATLAALWLLPYALVRLLWNRQGAVEATGSFLQNQIHESRQLLALAPLGWWMGLRAAWGAIGCALWDAPATRRFALALVLTATLAVGTLLAADLSRSVAVITPLVLAGCFAVLRRFPMQAPRLVLGCGVLNLLIPAAHVVHRHIDPIHPLPVELFRLLR
jgi:hypothetical protein